MRETTVDRLIVASIVALFGAIFFLVMILGFIVHSEGVHHFEFLIPGGIVSGIMAVVFYYVAMRPLIKFPLKISVEREWNKISLRVNNRAERILKEKELNTEEVGWIIERINQKYGPNALEKAGIFRSMENLKEDEACPRRDLYINALEWLAILCIRERQVGSLGLSPKKTWELADFLVNWVNSLKTNSCQF